MFNTYKEANDYCRLFDVAHLVPPAAKWDLARGLRRAFEVGQQKLKPDCPLYQGEKEKANRYPEDYVRKIEKALKLCKGTLDSDRYIYDTKIQGLLDALEGFKEKK